ncbi:MAG: diguanylate cyclase [Wenzhouxiangella sp.]
MVTLAVAIPLLFALILKPTSGADNDNASSFSELFAGFLYETNGVNDGVSADQFVDQLRRALDPDSAWQRVQLSLVECHYSLRNHADQRIVQGREGMEEALALNQTIEASLFGLCKALGIRDQHNPTAALPFIEQSLTQAEASGDHFVIGLVQSALADTRNSAEQFGPAMKALLSAHANFLAAERQDRAAALAIDMATIYRRIGHLAAAESLLQRTLEQLDDDATEDRLDAVLQLGMIHSAQGRHLDAASILESALQAAVNSQIPSLERGFHAAIAQAYLGLDQPERSLDHVRQAQEVHRRYNGGGRPALTLLESRALLALADHERAAERLNSMAPAMTDCVRTGLRRDWLATRADLKAAIGRHELAWQLMTKARELDRQIQQGLANEKIQALQAELSAREQQWARISARQTGLIDELSAQTQSQQQRNQFLIRSFLLVLGLALLLWGLSQFHQRRKLAKLAQQDELTGLLNRRGFFHAARKLGSLDPAAILVIDLDHFKQVNDRFGHAAGDQVLAALGRMMRGRSRAGDITGRMGGEEFALLLPGLNAEQAAGVAERLRCDWSAQRLADLPKDMELTMTIGLASSDEVDGQDLDRLLLLADQRLYHGKRHGRNQVVGPATCNQTR